MIKRHIKKGKSKAVEVVKKTTKQIGEELIEIPKQTVAEAVGKKGSYETPIVEAMQQKTVREELKKKKDEDIPVKKLDYLEKELEELRRRRVQEEQEKVVAERKGIIEKKEPFEVLLEPPAKRKRGLPIFGKKRPKGSGEVVKSKK